MMNAPCVGTTGFEPSWRPYSVVTVPPHPPCEKRPLDSRPPAFDTCSMKTLTWRPWRSYLRFRLRGLIVLVLVFGCWLGWIVRSTHIQRDAVAAIRQSGGFVAYDWEWKDNERIPNGRPWAPQWLVDSLGADYFGCVVFVSNKKSEWSDEEMVPLRNLSRLEKLALSSSRVTRAGLAHLKGLTNLRRLNLHNTQVGDEGLGFLDELTELRNLSLYDTKVGDAGLAHLKGLTRLRWLCLSGTKVGDVGLAHLEGLTNLQSLFLDGTRVCDAGLAHLEGLTSLEALHLSRDQVSDAGLIHLKGLTRLQGLYLDGTRVSDAGASELQFKALPHTMVKR